MFHSKCIKSTNLSGFHSAFKFVLPIYLLAAYKLIYNYTDSREFIYT